MASDPSLTLATIPERLSDDHFGAIQMSCLLTYSHYQNDKVLAGSFLPLFNEHMLSTSQYMATPDTGKLVPTTSITSAS